MSNASTEPFGPGPMIQGIPGKLLTPRLARYPFVRPPGIELGALEMATAARGGARSKSSPVPEPRAGRLGSRPHPRGTAPTPSSKPRDGARAVNSAELLAVARRELADSGKAELWGLHVQARSVTLLVGQTSAGKTTFLHRLSYSLAEGQEFLGITPPRPLRVLYADYESPLDVFVEHAEQIGTSPNLDFMDPEALPKGQALITALETMVSTSGYDVVIVDPLLVAFPVASEDDNAEATAQMEHFRLLARRTGAGLVLVHNSGQRGERESAEDDPFFGRGASARQDRSDVGLNFRKAGGTRRYLKVVKSRRRNHGVRIDFEFSGGLGYRLCASQAQTTALQRRDLAAEAARIVREESGAGRPETTRKTIRERLEITNGTAEDRALTEALKGAVAAGRLQKGTHGHYKDPYAMFDTASTAQ